jgi:uncharacterized protein (DUF952 family)
VRVFHLATVADWRAAQRSGSYTTSTIGRTLEEEGFIHASRREQVQPTWQRFYRDVREPLVLLTIDTDELTCEWREDPVGDDTYPHLYGPLNVSAVVRTQRLDRHGGTSTFATLLVREVGVRIVLALVAMSLAGLGSVVGASTDSDWGAFAGALVGLALGVVAFVVVLRRRG